MSPETKVNPTTLSAAWRCIACIAAMLISASATAAMEDDPLLAKLSIDRLEVRDTENDGIGAWEADLWIGKDLHKVRIKSRGERADGETETAEWQLLYNQAIFPYWDFQIGWRKDRRPRPQRDYLMIGFEGLAPYFFEVGVALFLREGNRMALRVEIERKLVFTQRVILEPEIELNVLSYNDRDIGIGAGLSDIEAGLRLHYAVTRQFMPYVGIEWEKKIGDTADYARERGESVDEFRWVAGINLWL